MGKLYRSEELAGLTEQDIQYLQQSGLKLVCDYRTDFEVKHKPNPEMNGVRQVGLPVMQDIAKDLNINEFFEIGDVSMLGKPGEYLVKMNKDFVTDNEAFVRFYNLRKIQKIYHLLIIVQLGKTEQVLRLLYYYLFLVYEKRQ